MLLCSHFELYPIALLCILKEMTSSYHRLLTLHYSPYSENVVKLEPSCCLTDFYYLIYTYLSCESTQSDVYIVPGIIDTLAKDQ